MWEEVDFSNNNQGILVNYDSDKYSARVDMGQVNITINPDDGGQQFDVENHNNEFGEAPVVITKKSNEKIVWDGVMDINIIQGALDMMEQGFNPEDAINAMKL